MAGMTKPLRPIKPGLSNLGGGIKLLLFTLDQFTADVEWPKRADIIAGKSSVTPTIITTETAARVIFDINKGVKMKVNGKGPTTNQVFDHSFEGAVVTGYTAEQNEALGNIYNMPCVAIFVLADGTKVVLGSTFKPLMIESDYDSGAMSADVNGTTLKGMSIQPLDFRPVILGSAVTIAETTIPAYS